MRGPFFVPFLLEPLGQYCPSPWLPHPVSTTLSSLSLHLPSETAAPKPETWGPLGLLTLPHTHIQPIPSVMMMVMMMIVGIHRLLTCQATHQTVYLLLHRIFHTPIISPV